MPSRAPTLSHCTESACHVSLTTDSQRSLFSFVGPFLTYSRGCMKDQESANCRLEANYAHQQELDMVPLMLTEGFRPKGWLGDQQELDMVPLMLTEGFRPKGWLGLILGTRMRFAFWDADQVEDAAFEHRLDAVVREIGDRGKLMSPEAATPFHEPTPAPAPAPKRAPAPAPAPAPAAAAAPAAAPVMKRPAKATPRPHHRTPPTRSFDPVGVEQQQQAVAEMQPGGGEFAMVPAGSPLSGACVRREGASRAGGRTRSGRTCNGRTCKGRKSGESVGCRTRASGSGRESLCRAQRVSLHGWGGGFVHGRGGGECGGHSDAGPALTLAMQHKGSYAIESVLH